MKGHPPLSPLRGRGGLVQLEPRSAWRVAWAAAAIAAVCTIYSLSELSALIQQGNPGADRLNWREVAGRAVQHAEHLPQIHPHLPHLALQGGLPGAGGWKGEAVGTLGLCMGRPPVIGSPRVGDRGLKRRRAICALRCAPLLCAPLLCRLQSAPRQTAPPASAEIVLDPAPPPTGGSSSSAGGLGVAAAAAEGDSSSVGGPAATDAAVAGAGAAAAAAYDGGEQGDSSDDPGSPAPAECNAMENTE